MQEQLSHSQNFIRDSDLIKKLLKKTDIYGKDTVIDIGAGDGMITKELSKVAKKVISIELDPQSIQNLQITLADKTNVEILPQDFFQYQLPVENYKVFSNPPFNRTADIVRKFLDDSNPPSSMYLFMQKEAAERFIHKDNGKNSLISLIYFSTFEISAVSKVHRSSFVPIPNVDVVLTSFKKRKKALFDGIMRTSYNDFLSYVFSQWQPTVIQSMKNLFTKEQLKRIEKDLKLKGLKPTQISFKIWKKLFETFRNYVSPLKQEIILGSYEKQLLTQSSLEKIHRTRIAN